MRAFLSVVALGISVLQPSHAAAQPPTVRLATPTAAPCSIKDASEEKRDADLMASLSKSINQQGEPAIRSNAQQLEQVLQRAPSSGGYLENCPEGLMLRGGSVVDLIRLTVLLQNAEDHSILNGKRLIYAPSPYARAAFYLGSSAVSSERYADAVTYLKRGLAILPADPLLSTEAAGAMVQTGRAEEALGVVDAALRSGQPVATLDHARLLRSRGLALTELKRYDEAEEAYRQSLVDQPGHAGARNELVYIARLKAGGQSSKSVLMTATQAATTSPDAVKAEKNKAAPAPPPKQP